MCGIVGYIGHRSAPEVLINGLRRLEYRGYDSAGLAIVDHQAIKVVKSAGKVEALAQRMAREWGGLGHDGVRIGIAHTRWATHGPPTEVNAHPHGDQTGRIALVHNGIIENYASLRAHLMSRGHTFKSETDTEVLAHLVGEFYESNDLMGAVCAALRHVEGTFGIAVLAADRPAEIVIARRGSPLIIGLGVDETIVASDASALISYTRQVMYLNDDDVALVTAGGAEIRNIHNVPVSREVARIDWEPEAAEKGGYEHFMLKEIFEQPEALKNTLRGRLNAAEGTANLAGLALPLREVASIKAVSLVACGTSLHAGMVGRYFFEELADVPTVAEQAAEFRYRNPILNADTLVVAISQSGETADTLAAVREAIRKGALVAGLCNVVGSTIARETGRGVYLHAGPEIGVASTKAFTCQAAVLLMMALKLGRSHRLSREAGVNLVEEILALPDAMRAALEHNDEIARIAGKYASARSFFFIGRGPMYPVALEGALKLKEISYIHAEGYHAAELKHGPIALLEPEVPVLALMNDLPGRDKMIGNLQECRARHAPVIAVVTEGDEETGKHASDVIRVPRTGPHIAPIVSAVALQLFAYHAARARGCPIDQPRNLAKSVTVE